MKGLESLDKVLDAGTREVIERAFAAHHENRTEYREQPRLRRGHDLSQVSDDEKRHTYEMAVSGALHGHPGWVQLARREDVDIGVWLWFYENWSRPPTEDDLARMWP